MALSNNPRQLASFTCTLFISVLFSCSNLFAQAILSQVFSENNPTEGSSPTSLIEMNGRVFFIANHDEVYEVNASLETAKISFSHALGMPFSAEIAPLPAVNKIFLSAFNFDEYGVEPSLLDPNTGDIEPVGGFISETYSAQVGTIITLNDKVVFSASENNVWSVWSTDGTVEGTVQLINGEGFPSVSFQYFDFIQTENYVYLERGGTLWVTDGTQAGTFSREDFNSFFLSKRNLLTSGEGFVYLVTRTYDTPQIYEIWRFNNDISHAEKVYEFEPTTTPNASVEIIDGSPYFAYNTFSAGSWDCYLYRLNEITLDFTLVKQFNGTIDPLNSTGSQAFFQVTDPTTSSTGFWRTQGSEETTIKLIDQNQLSSVLVNSVLGEKILFNSSQASTGTETWVSDGTVEGTKQLVETYPGPLSGYGSLRFRSETFEKIFFQAKSPIYGTEFWVTDGTPENTVFLGDLNQAPSPTKVSGITANDKDLFVVGNVGNTSEPNLFKYNTPNNSLESVLDKDIVAAVFASNILPYNDKIYFGGSLLYHPDVPNEFSLLLSYGESGVSTPLRSQFASSFPNNFRELNNLLFFTAFTEGNELWVTDGTDEGTHLVKNIAEGYLSAFDAFQGSGDEIDLQITYHNSKYYFAANDGINGNEVWVSDLSEEGTELFLDLNPGSESSNPKDFYAFGETLLFSAKDGSGSEKLFASDGSSTSITELINEPAVAFYELNNMLYIVTRNSAAIHSLWKTDGTTSGTSLVNELGYATGYTLSSDNIPAVKCENGLLSIKRNSNSSLDYIFYDQSENPHLIKTEQNLGLVNSTSVRDRIYYFDGSKLMYTDGNIDEEIIDLTPYAFDQYTIKFPTIIGQNIFFSASVENKSYVWKIKLDATLEISLEGEPIIDNQLVDFGALIYTTESAPKTITIKNVGFIDWEFPDDLAFEITGDHADDFIIESENPPSILKPGEETTISVKFHPTDGGIRAANLEINFQAGLVAPVTVTLQGTGINFPQTLTSNVPSTVPFSDLPVTLDITSSSGLEPILSSSNTDIVYFEQDKMLTKGLGEVTITANQPGNEYFLPATPIDIPITIGVGGQTITLVSSTIYTFGDDATNLIATSSSGNTVSFESSDPSILEINGTLATIVKPGQLTITARADGNEFFNAAEQAFEITIAKADQAISFLPPSEWPFGEILLLSASGGASGLPITFSSSDESVLTIAGSSATPHKPGAVTITASQAGNDYYQEAEMVARQIIIKKGEQAIDFSMIENKIFGDIPFELLATSNKGLPIQFSSSNPNIIQIQDNLATIIGAGSVIIAAQQVGNEFYNQQTTLQEILVDKSSQSILFNELVPKTYGAGQFELDGSVSSALTISYSSSDNNTLSVDGNIATILKAGEVVITASQPGNQNYEAATPVKQTLTINKASQYITFNTLPEKTYGDPSFELSSTTSTGLPATFTSSNPAVVTVEGSEATILGAGSATITASLDGNDNYLPASADQTIAVNKAAQSITFDELPTLQADDAPFELTASATSGLPVTFVSQNESIAVVTGNTLTVVAPGETTISALQPGNDNYLAAEEVVRTLVVEEVTGLRKERSSKILVYPNPSQTRLYIKTSGTNTIRYNLTSIAGETTLSGKLDTNGETIIEMESLKKGIYLLTISSDENNTSYRIIKEN